MESFAAPQSEEEAPKTREELMEEIAKAKERIAVLRELSANQGENIDADFDSPELIDFGHEAEARELEVILDELKAELTALDDEAALDTIADAAQRKLDI